MKRFAVCMAGVIAVSINVLAQRGAPAPPQPLEPGASQADVDKALLAAPGNTKNQAMVVKWKPADLDVRRIAKGCRPGLFR